jgi:hypothetical protein
VKSAETFIPTVDEAIKALSNVINKWDNLAELLADRARLNGKAK